MVPTVTLGTPVLSCPMGKSEDGLPIGIQMHGPRFADRWLLSAAEVLHGGAEQADQVILNLE